MTDEIAEKIIAAASSCEKVVFHYDFSVDGRVLLNHFTKEVQNKAVLMVTVDEKSDKFTVLAACIKV